MKRTKRIFALSTTILVAIVTMAIGTPRFTARADNKPETEVKIDNFSFGPDITIAVGSTVTWTNQDDVPHTVASDTKLFKSNALDTDDRFSYPFTKPGTFVYYCSIHPRMVAKVVVR